jgi:predicted metal-dependent phosphoesterase TrpH
MTNIRIDFHVHTIASKDSLTSPEQLILACRRKGLDRVVITDHNALMGAREAYALDPELVVVGEEIMTTRGEILAAYVSEEVPPGLSPLETICKLREQGAFISVSHPFDAWRSGGWQENDLMEIVSFVDAIEVFNARCLLTRFNREAQEFAKKHGLAKTAGSDAHATFELGAGSILLPAFKNADELRMVIRDGRVMGRLSPFWVHFVSRYANTRKRLGYN